MLLFKYCMQGEIFIRSGSVVDREASTGLQINSAGEGVISFEIIAVNEGVDKDLTATATVSASSFPNQWATNLLPLCCISSYSMLPHLQHASPLIGYSKDIGHK